jgi:two-component system, NtrC family, response regulator HydG
VPGDDPEDDVGATRPHAVVSAETSARFRLTIVEGESRGVHLDIDGGEGPVLIGKSPVCALRLDDPLASRRHVSLEVVKSSLRLVDLGSTNGTFVGALRVVDAFLEGGETIRIGGTFLSVTRAPSEGVVGFPARAAFGKLVGSSRQMLRLYPLLERLAGSTVPVLIEGETGTGKEVLAESLHLTGPRRDRPFIVFDCTAVAPSLVESELFGHERGAFTGATTSRKGVFEIADGGSLLIDEIGDLDPAIQPKLLRVLERGEVRRVGGTETVKVDVRVLSATRRDLDLEVQRGRFRDDLFHRLVVARVELPPLRRRSGDIAELARHFAREIGGTDAVLSEAIVSCWEDLPWPGNVRELRNAVARQLALGDLLYDVPLDEDAVISSGRGDAPSSPELADQLAKEASTIVERVLAERMPLVPARQRLIEEFDRAYLASMLSAHGGNVTRAAAAAGLARRNFQLLRSRRGV